MARIDGLQEVFEGKGVLLAHLFDSFARGEELDLAASPVHEDLNVDFSMLREALSGVFEGLPDFCKGASKWSEMKGRCSAVS